MSSQQVTGSIEWYTYTRADGTIGEDHMCARCGSSAAFAECYECGGEGGHIGEDIASGYDYGWIDEDAWYRCSHCRGHGGSWHCISSPEWCEANPLPDRENIPSTALRYWDD